MSQLVTLLLGASILVGLLQMAIAAAPVVKFIPPASFAVGTIFVARCTIVNFVPANVTDKRYSVNFNFLSTEKGNPEVLLAEYLVKIDPDSFVFNNPDLSILTEVSAAQGDVHLFPDFEVRINPRGDKARSKYWCSLKVNENGFNNEYKSNVWNLSFSAIPSAVLLAFLTIIAFKFQW